MPCITLPLIYKNKTENKTKQNKQTKQNKTKQNKKTKQNNNKSKNKTKQQQKQKQTTTTTTTNPVEMQNYVIKHFSQGNGKRKLTEMSLPELQA